MNKYLVIKLNTVSDMLKFDKLVNTLQYDVNISNADNKIVIDAKSLLGICSLDLNKELHVEPIIEDEVKLFEFSKLLKDFIVTR